MNFSKTHLNYAAIAGIALTSGLAQADTITGVIIEAVSSSFSNGVRPPENLINGNGFTEATGFHSNANGDGINWINDFNTDTLPTFVTFDLEGVYDLGSTKIWNWNTSTTLNAGVQNFSISVASTVGGTFTSLGSFVLNQSPGLNNVDFGQVFDLSGFAAADTTRLVRFDITSNYGFGPQSLAGLSEVRFDGVPVPEPSAAAKHPLTKRLRRDTFRHQSALSSNIYHFFNFAPCQNTTHSSLSTYYNPSSPATPFLPLSNLSNNVLRDTPQKVNS